MARTTPPPSCPWSFQVSSCRLDTLPEELLLRLIANLRSPDLLSVALVSRSFCSLVDNVAERRVRSTLATRRDNERWTRTLQFASALAALPAPSISAGQSHALWVRGGCLCAVGGAASTDDDNHCLGLGGTRQQNRFVPVPAGSPLFRVHITEVSAGYLHSLALSDAGCVWSFGSNDFGQLGRGFVGGHHGPVAVIAEGCRHVAAGGFSSFACRLDGRVLAFGGNAYGELGLPPPLGDLPQPSPTLVDALQDAHIVQAAAGRAHSLMLSSTGTVYAAGRDEYGQLGVGSEGGRTGAALCHRLIRSLAEHRVVLVVCGNNHSLAVTDGGALWVWGCNDAEQLGIPSSDDSPPQPVMMPWLWDAERPSRTARSVHPDKRSLMPVHVPMPGVVIHASAGHAHSLALVQTADGRRYVHGFGHNGARQRGSDSHLQVAGLPGPRISHGADARVRGERDMAGMVEAPSFGDLVDRDLVDREEPPRTAAGENAQPPPASALLRVEAGSFISFVEAATGVITWGGDHPACLMQTGRGLLPEHVTKSARMGLSDPAFIEPT